ncbi:flagellar protein FlaG [Desulfobaculum sp. SPO524]|uniref:flagellar protein FlaG n=1 Tax=Desulfobaculum sp. SPO524 TaxID=3378071 RepID=UPI0038539F0E
MNIKNIHITAAEAYGSSGTGLRPAQHHPDARQDKATPSPTAREETQAQNARKQSVQAAREVLEPMERFAENVGVDLKFHINTETGEMQAEVRDASGQKVIRKVPADEVLRLAASIKELSHSFFDRSL